MRARAVSPEARGLPPGVFDSSNWDEAEFAGAQTDFDGDGVVDAFDAFPQDPAASVDEDKDGFPDRWNDGKGEQDSTSGLTLDESPGGVIPVGKFNEARWGRRFMARCKGAKVMKSRISSLFGLGLLLGVASSGIAAEVPHVFQPGQVIESSKMNENFAFLAQSGGGKRAEYNIDCSSGTNLLTETIAGASATEIDITISGVCVEDHLKFDAYTAFAS